MRAFDRRVLEEISLYGDQHRFLPVLANRQGFRVAEIDVRQSPRDRFDGTYGPRDYVRRALDIFSVFFLVRFTKRPLRFFGMIGAVTFGLGALITAWLVIDRLFLGHALGDRPALLLSSLLVVLGLQLFALGLLGELIIFTHAREMKDYKVDRIIEYPETDVTRAAHSARPRRARGQRTPTRPLMATTPSAQAESFPSICLVGLMNLPVLAREYAHHGIGGMQVQQTLLGAQLAKRGFDVSMVVHDLGQPDGASWDGITTWRAFAPTAGIPVLRYVHPRWTSMWAALKRADADIYYVSGVGMMLGLVAMFARRYGRKYGVSTCEHLGLPPRHDSACS